MVLIAYGLRASEVAGLRLDDLDWERAGELARSERESVVPGGARRGVFGGSEGLAQDLILVLSQPTQC